MVAEAAASATASTCEHLLVVLVYTVRIRIYLKRALKLHQPKASQVHVRLLLIYIYIVKLYTALYITKNLFYFSFSIRTTLCKFCLKIIFPEGRSREYNFTPCRLLL